MTTRRPTSRARGTTSRGEGVRRGPDEQAVLHVDRAARQVALAAVERPGERRVRAPAAHRVEGLRVDAHGRAQLDLAPRHGESEQQRLDQVPGSRP
jgi:hypothetical protein